uniref:NADH dehydrogenase subunit 2 n=1 Tax=Cichlidogyrus sclerosus TaxID=341068 RepID=A0A3G0WZB2_9PLAT|nr:NADH dehydrogenase subunit 2 [Cichlidogyrus sclerosus]
MGLFLLAGFLYVVSLSWPSFLGVWLAMEAAGLIVLTGFFTVSNLVNRYVGLLGAVIASGVGSGMLFLGILNEDLAYLLFLSILLKVGMFPFVGWVVVVLVNSPWVVLYFMSCVSKISLVYFSSYLSFVSLDSVLVFYFFSFVVLVFILLNGLYDFKMLFAISSISTGCLLVTFLVGAGVEEVLKFLGVYLVFSFVFLLMISGINVGYAGADKTVISVFTLLGVPFSVGILYKFVGSYTLLNMGIYFVLVWVIYSCLEFMLIGVWLFEKSAVVEVW